MYALLGSGRLAKHFSFYLNSLGLEVTEWSRQQPEAERRLGEVVQTASHILLAVSDSAIPLVTERVRELAPGKTLVHFSGSVTIEGVAGAHPLMTFGAQLEALDWYQSIPFAVEEGYKFAEILPGLPNSHYSIPANLKGLYHALCSLAGNSTFILWQRIGDQFEQLGLPRELLRPFLHQVVSNSSRGGEQNFTGPVARGDWGVVRSHLDSLKLHPELFSAYQNYLRLAALNRLDMPKDLL